MATSLTLENDSSLAQGYIKVNGSTAATLTTSGITGNLTGNVTGSLTAGGSLTLATAQTATGTAVDFTSIPSWAKRITVMFNGVSTNGAGGALTSIQLGTVSGFESTGYVSYSTFTSASSSVSTSTSMFLVRAGSGATADFLHGSVTLITLGANIWVESGVLASPNTGYTFQSAGSKTISNTLDRVRITTTNGTDTFDAGTINISYEG